MLEPEEEGADSHNGSVITSRRVDLGRWSGLCFLQTEKLQNCTEMLFSSCGWS